MRKENGKQKKFKYRLDTVLKAREVLKKQQQEAVTRAQATQEAELKKEKDLKNQQTQAYQDLRGDISKGATLDFTKIILRKAHLEKVATWVDEQVVVRKKADQKLADERATLLQRARDEKVIQKDKERRHKLWGKAVRREETKQLDDLSTGRFTRDNTR